MDANKIVTGTERKKTLKKEKTAKEQIATNICIRTDPTWEFVYMYLDLLNHTCVKYDKGFYCRYVRLMDYVGKKIKLPDCKIADEYHVYEVTLNNE